MCIVEKYHIPALLMASVDALGVRPYGVYADATFGGGGHSREILSRLSKGGRLFGFDQDADAAANAFDDPRFTFVHSNFRYMRNFLDLYGALPADGVIADLGVSFHHFDTPGRGFSFRADAPLDMRMNQSSALSAADVVNGYDRDQLTRIFAAFTDLKRPDRVADAIISQRAQAGISTTGALLDAVTPALNPRAVKKDAAQVFQAIRIEVNGEIRALEALLLSLSGILRPGGRAAILTYHSIEDRIVKNFFRSGRIDGKVEKDFFGRSTAPWKPVGRNPILPSPQEVEQNPRARSAKLRVAEYQPLAGTLK